MSGQRLLYGHAGTRQEVDDLEIPFQIPWIDVLLFPQKIGLLAMKVRLEEERPTIGRINEFLYRLRLIHPPNLGWRMARLQGKEAADYHVRDLVDFLLQGLADVPASETSGP